MGAFEPQTKTLSGRLTAPGPIDRVFPLFSPEGETHWVPGWKPEYVLPATASWEPNQIFRTHEETGPVVWWITRLDRESHRADYHRLEPSRFLSKIEVSARSLSEFETEVAVSYSYVGLTGEGNARIVSMTEDEYAGKMLQWTEWLQEYLG